MKKLCVYIAIIISLFSVGLISLPVWTFAASHEWPTFHGNPARTGFSDSKVPASANLLWEITTTQLKDYGVTDFEIFTPIIDQGKVFFSAGQVFAADLYSGKILWNFKGDRENFYAIAQTAAEGKIFARVVNSNQLKTMSEGFIYALEAKDGKLLWKYQTKKQISHSNPVFAEGKIFVGDESGSIYAIDAMTGKLVWQQQLDAYQIHSSPAYDGGVIYVGTETTDEGARKSVKGSYMYALSAKDGRVIWQFESDWRSYEMPNLIHGTPAVLDGVVYFGSENGWFYALNKSNGKVIWKRIITEKERTTARQAAGVGLVGVSTAPALGYGKIFVSTWEGKFLALSQKDGSTVWEYRYGDEGSDSSAVLADGKVCLGSHYLDFYCFNGENGKVLWKEKLGGPSAALADGILVVPNALAAAESPGSILVAFSDRGITGSSNQLVSKISFDDPNFKIISIAVLGLAVMAISYMLLKYKKATLKQLLIFGGVSLALVIAGFLIYRQYNRLQWTQEQDTLIQEGKIDETTGSFIGDDGIKHIEYQGKRYLIGDGFCGRSALSRFAITVKRFNGAVAADGSDGNTMYAIGKKEDPEYIDTKNQLGSEIKEGGLMRDCWKKEAK